MRRILFILTVIVIAACKKNDSAPPKAVIEFWSDTSVAYRQVISFRIRITDDRKLEEARVSILNMHQRQFLSPLVFALSSTEKTIEGEFRFDDVHMPGGDYYVQVITSDGENEGADVQSFQYTEAPLELSYILAYTPNPSSTAVYRFSDNTWIQAFQIPSEPLFSWCDSYHQRFITAGNSTQGIQSFHPGSGHPLGSSPALYNGEYLWNGETFDSIMKQWWLTGKDGSIRCYSSDGTARGQFATFGNFIPGSIAVTGQHVIVAVDNPAQTQHRLDVYNKNSGQLLQSLNLPEHVQELTALNNERIWFHSPERMYPQSIYLPASNAVDEWSNFRFAQQGFIHEIASSGSRLYMRYDDGLRVYSKDGIFGGFYGGNDIQCMEYEKKEDLLYILENDEWKVLNGSTLNLIGTFAIPQAFRELRFVYNK